MNFNCGAPSFAVSPCAGCLISVENVDLVSYDPVGRIMENLILEDTDIDTECVFELL
jgi:hypothetical protein